MIASLPQNGEVEVRFRHATFTRFILFYVLYHFPMWYTKYIWYILYYCRLFGCVSCKQLTKSKDGYKSMHAMECQLALLQNEIVTSWIVDNLQDKALELELELFGLTIYSMEWFVKHFRPVFIARFIDLVYN